MAQINFRIDDETKHRAEELFASLGLTMSSAITVFIHHSLDYQGLPFVVQKRDDSARPMSELLRRLDDYKHGRNYHFHDLIEADDDKPSARSRKPRGVAKTPRKPTNSRRRVVA